MTQFHHTDDQVCLLCEDKLSLAHPDLQSWFRDRIKPLFPRCHISWTYRDETAQEQAVLDHKSKCHYPNSAHNKQPARAIDIFEIDINGQGVWNPKFFSSINSFNSVNSIHLKWGAIFKELGDYDHFELPPS